MKIKSINYGIIDFDPLLPNNTQEYRELFYKQNITLPLELFGKSVCKKDFVIEIFLEIGVLRVHVKAGLVLDYASVPRLLRSFVDDNDPAIIIASIFHDVAHILQYPSFSTSNKFFKTIIKLEGGSYWMRFLAFAGVNSKEGKEHYYKTSPYEHYVIDNKLCKITLDSK
jgi:hypothetical protein